jgi:hypothetical protein
MKPALSWANPSKKFCGIPSLTVKAWYCVLVFWAKQGDHSIPARIVRKPRFFRINFISNAQLLECPEFESPCPDFDREVSDYV